MIDPCLATVQVTVQAEYHVKTPSINGNGQPVEDEDLIPPEAPPRTDYGKKALVSPVVLAHTDACSTSHRHWSLEITIS